MDIHDSMDIVSNTFTCVEHNIIYYFGAKWSGLNGKGVIYMWFDGHDIRYIWLYGHDIRHMWLYWQSSKYIWLDGRIGKYLWLYAANG